MDTEEPDAAAAIFDAAWREQMQERFAWASYAGEEQAWDTWDARRCGDALSRVQYTRITRAWQDSWCNLEAHALELRAQVRPLRRAWRWARMVYVIANGIALLARDNAARPPVGDDRCDIAWCATALTARDAQARQLGVYGLKFFATLITVQEEQAKETAQALERYWFKERARRSAQGLGSGCDDSGDAAADGEQQAWGAWGTSLLWEGPPDTVEDCTSFYDEEN